MSSLLAWCVAMPIVIAASAYALVRVKRRYEADLARDALNGNIHYWQLNMQAPVQMFRVEKRLWSEGGCSIAQTKKGSFVFYRLEAVGCVGNKREVFETLASALGPKRAVEVACSLGWSVGIGEV